MGVCFKNPNGCLKFQIAPYPIYYYLFSYCNEESLALIFNLTEAEIFLQVQLCGVIWIRLVSGPICGSALD